MKTLERGEGLLLSAESQMREGEIGSLYGGRFIGLG